MSTNAKAVNADILVALRARSTLLLVRSDDEQRFERAAFAIASAAKFETRFWDCDTGVTNGEGRQIDRSQDPNAFLDYVRRCKDRVVYVARDFHKWFDPGILRKLRNLHRELATVATPNEARVLLLLSTMDMEIPRGVPEMISWDYPLPDREEVSGLVDSAVNALPELTKEGKPLRANAAPNGKRDRAIDGALGLSAFQIENSYSRSLVTSMTIDGAYVAGEKKRVISGIPGVTWYDADPRGLDAVGGCNELKSWCLSRKPAFSSKARAFGLPSPKGVVLVGPPGTGKSLTAKCVATTFGLPLLRFDPNATQSKFVGESGSNFRRVLALAETVAPCVLWVDEIEKAMGGATGPQGDGGVSADALGTLLSWMQEKTATVFVIATANDVRALPPELLRKGRFDELFFVDLPQLGERAEIVAASLKAFDRPIDGIDLAAVANVTDGFVGAEIAALVPDALFEAFADGERALTTEDLKKAASKVVPLSKTASERIQALREWAKGRARPASTPEVSAAGTVRSLDL